VSPPAATVCHVRVNHGGLNVLVPQQLSHGPDVVAVLQQVGCRRVPDRLLNDRFVQVVTMLDARTSIDIV